MVKDLRKGGPQKILGHGTPLGEDGEHIFASVSEEAGKISSLRTFLEGVAKISSSYIRRWKILHSRLHLLGELLHGKLRMGGSLDQVVHLRSFVVNKETGLIVSFWFEESF